MVAGGSLVGGTGRVGTVGEVEGYSFVVVVGIAGGRAAEGTADTEPVADSLIFRMNPAGCVPHLQSAWLHSFLVSLSQEYH